MEPIPAPQVLDPERISRDDREEMTKEDHRSQSQLLGKALDESCAYAQQMWNDLAAMRTYLYESLPTGLSSDTPPEATAARAEDERRWQQWMDAYAAVTSVLCGPHGDSGFGASSARVLAQNRRAGVTDTTDVDNAAAAPDSAQPDPPPPEPSVDTAPAPASAPTSGRDVLTHTFAANPMLPGALGAVVGALVVTRLRRNR